MPEDHFEEFFHLIKSLQPIDYHYLIEGNFYTLIKNPMYPLGFCLSPDDTKNLIDIMEQAKLAEEAFSILYK